MNSLRLFTCVALVASLACASFAQATSTGAAADRTSLSIPQIVQTSLIAPGSPPFHLKAVITEKGNSDSTDVEIYWARADEWRRNITSDVFSQTLIVNGNDVFEKDSDPYFPLALHVLVTAMVNPKPVLESWHPGDALFTKANGLSKESGAICLTPNAKRCLMNPLGLTEFVGVPGHSLWFTDYRKFEDQRVARQLIYRIDAGDSFTAKITKLEKLKQTSQDLFSIPTPTPEQACIQTVTLEQDQLEASALQPLQIVWPQVLDGATSGETSYYVSIDRSGNVREVLPVSVAVERADDSARRQIRRWKFKPILENGIAVQAEVLLNFHFDTRAYGPSAPLTDTEVRKLASDTIEPDFPSGTAPGTICSYRIAVDSDGDLIEAIVGGCPSRLAIPTLKAIQKWHFRPIVENRQALPYRGVITFRAP